VVTSEQRVELRRQALSISLSVMPFGVAFGVSCTEAGLGFGEAMGFSLLVFTGGTQFAAVRVLGDGGTVYAAIAAGWLLAIRSLAYGVVMAPALGTKPRWWRALASQWMIDETMAVGMSQPDRDGQRYGYLLTGVALYTCWNVATAIGALLSQAGDLVTATGIDATIPAAFLALVWPRLADPAQRWVVVSGAAIATALVPIAPAGIPIIAAAVAIVVARR
jgi:predicted branched-subunit amino acid permease